METRIESDDMEARMERNENTGLLDKAKVGEGVRWKLFTDVEPGYIVGRTEKTITVRAAHATLMNGFNSGTKDELTFSPGGFCGHTSGEPRYEFAPNPDGAIMRFSRRRRGWKLVGWRSDSPGYELYFGIGKFYDYNF